MVMDGATLRSNRMQPGSAADYIIIEPKPNLYRNMFTLKRIKTESPNLPWKYIFKEMQCGCIYI